MAQNSADKTDAMFSEGDTYNILIEKGGKYVQVTRRHSEDGEKEPVTRAIMLGHRLIKKLATADDRSFVMVGVSFVDELLSRSLRLSMKSDSAAKRLLSTNGALGAIGARTDLCEAMGFIRASTATEIRTLSSIRNKLAHRVDIENLEDLAQSCENLSSIDNWFDPTDRTPRGRVHAAIVTMICDIPNRWPHIKRQRAALETDLLMFKHGAPPNAEL